MNDNLEPKRWRLTKEGDGYRCDGMCHSWDLGICTCGLLSHLEHVNTSATPRIAFVPKAAEVRNELCLEVLRKNRVPRACDHGVPYELDCAQCKERGNALLTQIFGADFVSNLDLDEVDVQTTPVPEEVAAADAAHLAEDRLEILRGLGNQILEVGSTAITIPTGDRTTREQRLEVFVLDQLVELGEFKSAVVEGDAKRYERVVKLTSH